MFWRKKFPFKVDLDKWNYLGFTGISFVSETREILATIHFFKAKDSDRRHYYVDTEKRHRALFDHHDYICRNVKPWVLGYEADHAFILNPTRYLQDEMYKKFNWIWSPSHQWWRFSMPTPVNDVDSNNVISIS